MEIRAIHERDARHGIFIKADFISPPTPLPASSRKDDYRELVS